MEQLRVAHLRIARVGAENDDDVQLEFDQFLGKGTEAIRCARSLTAMDADGPAIHPSQFTKFIQEPCLSAFCFRVVL